MKKTIKLTLISAALLLSAIYGCDVGDGGGTASGVYAPAIFYTSDGGASWNVDTITNNGNFTSSSSAYFESIAVTGPGIYCVIYNGALWYSNDNFNTWNACNTGSLNFRKLKTGSGKNFGVGGLTGSSSTSVIYSSSDGTAWQQIHTSVLSSGQFVDIDANNNFVIAAGGNVVSYSNNNGLSWSDTALSPGDEITAVTITDVNSALVITKGGLVFYTPNVGASWVLRDTVPEYGVTSAGSLTGSGITFASTPGHIYKTLDFGNTWTDAAHYNALSFSINPNILSAVTGSQFIRSNDNGNTWVSQSLGGGNSLQAIYFQPDGMFGYVASGVRVQ